MNNNLPPNYSILSEIIREIPQYKKQKEEHLGNQIIIIDTYTGEILEEMPIIRVFKKLRFFELFRNRVIFDVPGPEISVNYQNSGKPFVLKISYSARIADKGIYHLIRTIVNEASPLDGVNNKLRQAAAKFIFDRKDFVNEFKQYQNELLKELTVAGTKCGLDLQLNLSNNLGGNGDSLINSFISCSHIVKTKTKDAQVVEIQHDLALTLTDSIKFRLSGIIDINVWAKNKLDQFTNNAVIDKNYADVLVNMEESMIRYPMQEACRSIGYELKQLITVPGLEIEKFYFETVEDPTLNQADYGTKDPRLKIALNIIVDGRLDLHNQKTQAFIKPGFDIIDGMKKNVVEYTRGYINQITPDDCFTQQFVFEENLAIQVRSKLEETYGFKVLNLVIKFLENDLSKRLSLLQEKPQQVTLSADWDERRYGLWFRVLGVCKEGWYRFRRNNYQTTSEELNDVARMIKNGMEAAILRTGDKISGTVIANTFKSLRPSVCKEFGLEIGLHDFNEAFSDEETLYIKSKKAENEEKYKRAVINYESETNEEAIYRKQKEMAIENEEQDDVIRKIDERIKSIREKSTLSKDKFLQQKTDNHFLLPDNHEFGDIKEE